MRAAQQKKCIEHSIGYASMYMFCRVKGDSGRVPGRVSEGFPAGFPWGFRGFPGVSEGRDDKSGLRKSWFFIAQRTLGRGFRAQPRTIIIILERQMRPVLCPCAHIWVVFC